MRYGGGFRLHTPAWEGAEKVGYLSVEYSSTGRIHMIFKERVDGGPTTTIPLDTKNVGMLISLLSNAFTRGHYQYYSDAKDAWESDKDNEIAGLKLDLWELKQKLKPRWWQRLRRKKTR